MGLQYFSPKRINNFIIHAFEEDIGEGDYSSLATIPQEKNCTAYLLIKDEGIIAGLDLIKHIFHHYDSDLIFNQFMNDGDKVKPKNIAFEISGCARSILASERLVLNTLQRMSGIASYTHWICSLISHTKAQLIDTRKTTPNFRVAEKWAVTIGGGKNHRFGLYDMIMLKDNHIDLVGGITKAVSLTKAYLKTIDKHLRIEVETRTLDDVVEALENKVDVIMLDNMDCKTMKKAVQIVNNQCDIEASGGITEKNIVEIAECGVDYISVGALTHSIKSKDMSLKIR